VHSGYRQGHSADASIDRFKIDLSVGTVSDGHQAFFQALSDLLRDVDFPFFELRAQKLQSPPELLISFFFVHGNHPQQKSDITGTLMTADRFASV
jgi:hypothetical protein